LPCFIVNELLAKLLLFVHFRCRHKNLPTIDSLPKENEPKERAANHLFRLMRNTLRYSKRPGAAKLASLRQSSRLSVLFCVARLREMAFF
jgi:hypothetical protein